MKSKKIVYPFMLCTVLLISCNDKEPEPSAPSDPVVEPTIYEFNGDGMLQGFTTNNENALPEVTQVEGRYHARVLDNEGNKTLHFNEEQGRLDALLLEFPFEFIARNIGIGTIEDSQESLLPTGTQYNFSGVQVHVTDLDDPNSAHVVVGHRGSTHFTIEGKNTVDGVSSVNDIGANMTPLGRADIRIVGNTDRTITVYWQEPNTDLNPEFDQWNLYNDTGELPGIAPQFSNEIYVGLITYAFDQEGLPFVGTCDQVEVYPLD